MSEYFVIHQIIAKNFLKTEMIPSSYVYEFLWTLKIVIRTMIKIWMHAPILNFSENISKIHNSCSLPLRNLITFWFSSISIEYTISAKKVHGLLIYLDNWSTPDNWSTRTIDLPGQLIYLDNWSTPTTNL